MEGIIYQINISNGGVPKSSVVTAKITTERVEGDRWNYTGHGGKEQAVCLFAQECLDALVLQGFPVFPGALGENFTTKYLDYHLVRIGDIWQVGTKVQIKITKVRTPCGTIRRAYSPSASKGEGIEAAMWDSEVKKGNVHTEKWGMAGFYAEVLREGRVSQGDRILKID
ncbi:MOSC domain-containing protein [Candidatus Woesearchaeota archaeon]|nr:MOSC domain-containing protein [Candidatus Woesearchaeota archaeon]